MFDAIHLQRSHGTAELALSGGRLATLRQQGSAKIMLPRCHGGRREAVFLNTSGGLTSGDRLAYRIALGAGDSLIATTQTAERAYRADGPPAEVQVNLTLGDGAALDWLPQDTILFDGAALRRDTVVEMAATARFLGIETIALGRAAMGETVRRLALTDRRSIRRDGRLALLDPLMLDDAALARAAGLAMSGGARAMAVLILAAPGAAEALPALRAEMDQPGVTAAASARDGIVIARCLAPDAWPLRRQMIRLLERLGPQALPRVWQN